MDISHINHYVTPRSVLGEPKKKNVDKEPKKGEIKDSFEPSSDSGLLEPPTAQEIAMIMDKIKVMPELRVNLLIQTKENIVHGKYNENEELEPIAEAVIS